VACVPPREGSLAAACFDASTMIVLDWLMMARMGQIEVPGRRDPAGDGGCVPMASGGPE